MPVRESLRQLETEGLVTRRPNRGLWVTKLEPQELRDLYDVRILLEPVAAASGVRDLTEAARSALPLRLAELDRAAEAGVTTDMLTADEDLLTAVYECCGNRELVNLIRRLWQRVRPYKLLYWSGRPADAGPQQLFTDDRHFVEASLAGDVTDAAHVVTSTLSTAQTALVDYVTASHRRDHSA
jgi:DNA-binding GntR family transcriptional regulator